MAREGVEFDFLPGPLDGGFGLLYITTMNDTTRGLLLKLRKDATSSWGPKHYAEAFEAIGFRVQIEKTGRSVAAVVFTSPAGHSYRAEKLSHHKVVTFYGLSKWLKDVGVDVVGLASEALGMDTPDEERRLKELYVRDLTNTGTCPVCEGNFKRNGTGLVHHGYQRPGDGAIHGDCFAVGYLPWELSPQGAEDYLKLALRPHLDGAKAHLIVLQGGEITKFFKKERVSGFGSRATYITVEVTRESNPYEFESILKSRIYDCERDIRWTEREIARFEARIAAWKPDDLPEVKHAGKFRVA